MYNLPFLLQRSSNINLLINLTLFVCCAIYGTIANSYPKMQIFVDYFFFIF